MTARRTYLDYNATAPLRPEARAAMVSAMDLAGNPSSVHADGRAARAVVEGAREEVAALAGCSPAEVVFTSGGTEANNQVMRAGWDTILSAAIEHDSVLAPARASGASLPNVGAAANGVCDVGEFAAHILTGDTTRGRVLASLQMANNETGVVQPVAELAAFARAHDIVTHTDAVQASGRLPLRFSELGVDLMTLSAHKLGGPKGIGALVIRRGLDVPPLVSGGGQERRRRSGTENIVGIAGFGASAKLARQAIGDIPRIAALRDEMEQRLMYETPHAMIIGAESDRLANTTCIAMPGANAELLVIKLDLAGVSVSAGAACSSGKVAASHVLTAMGLEEPVTRGAIRISIGRETTREDIDRLVAVWRTIASRQQPNPAAGDGARLGTGRAAELEAGEI